MFFDDWIHRSQISSIIIVFSESIALIAPEEFISINMKIFWKFASGPIVFLVLFYFSDGGIAVPGRWMGAYHPSDPNHIPGGSPNSTNDIFPDDLFTPGSRIEYVVKPGDNLVLIASLFNSTAEAIAALNNMAVTDTLFVGRVLIVPVGIATPTITPTPNPFTPTPTPLP